MATDFSKLTVFDLRQELRRRGLIQTGKKADLVERLVASETGAPSETLHESSGSPNAYSESKSKRDENSALRPSEDLLMVQTPEVPEPTTAPTLDLGTQSDSAQVRDKMSNDEDLEVELAPPVEEQPSTAMSPIQDTTSRKRRSRSPPPDDELSRKRTRVEDELRMEPKGNSPDEVSYAIIQPAVPKSSPDANSRIVLPPDTDRPTQDDITARFEEHGAQHQQLAQSMEEHEDEVEAEDDRNVAPAEHRATPALYIKNFMRPLRDTILRAYLAEIATPRGSPTDPAVIEDFHLDQIRTHAFVRFRTTAAALRARIALHGRIWPNERERRPLWADFIPVEAVAEWADRERSEGERGTRWEVRYEKGGNGDATAYLTIADADTSRPPRPPPPSGPPASFVAGSSRSHGGIESAPLGPRGRGSNTYYQQPISGYSEGLRETRAYPSLFYRPVSDELAERRLRGMRKYYTQDRDRNLGRPDEINRYTFEQGDMFVDRGKENFIGIRPPHRERERQRALAGGDYRGPHGFRGSSPSRRSRGERYFGGDRDSRYSGGPRSDRHAGNSRNDRYSVRYDDRRDRNDGHFPSRYNDRRGRRDDRHSDRYDDRQGRKDDHYSSGGRDRYEDDRHAHDAPRSRLDGAPLPTYDGPKFGGRSGRGGDDYRSGRR